MNENNYMLIAVEYLNVGDRVNSDVYVKYQKPLLMIREGQVLTLNMLNSLHRSLKGGRNVYVSADYYYELLKNGVPKSLQQVAFEQSVGYDTAKKETDGMLYYLKTTGVVSAEMAQNLSENLSQKISTLDAATIIQCINGKNNIDEYLCTHSTNVALLNGLMGKWLGLPPVEVDLLITAGLLHDVGKSEIPPEILDAPRKLTEEEFETMKMHSIYSYELLVKNPKIDPLVVTAARSHHEKMNGKGYPDGLSGDLIPLFARITAISDVYDAMVSSRCYKSAQSPFNVLHELSIGRFSDLDYNLIARFLEMMPSELVGKTVFMSDGTVAVVQHVDPKKWKYPIVVRDDEVVRTDDELYCESIVI